MASSSAEGKSIFNTLTVWAGQPVSERFVILMQMMFASAAEGLCPAPSVRPLSVHPHVCLSILHTHAKECGRAWETKIKMLVAVSSPSQTPGRWPYWINVKILEDEMMSFWVVGHPAFSDNWYLNSFSRCNYGFNVKIPRHLVPKLWCSQRWFPPNELTLIPHQAFTGEGQNLHTVSNQNQ